jgi:hypothetical protein
MGKIVLDEQMERKLAGISDVTQLCDKSGRIIAFIVPASDLAEWETTEPDISEEELTRRENSGKWYTTAEVLARLKSFESK